MNSERGGGRDCLVCRYMARLRRVPFGALRRLYRFIFARPVMQNINDRVLDLALHGKGYRF